MISLGVDSNAHNDIAIKWAAQCNRVEIVKYLISIAADPISAATCALMRAASNNWLELLQYLVSIGGDIAAQYNYAIRWSSQKGHFGIVKYLVTVGQTQKIANPNCKFDICAAVRIALKNGYDNIVDFLVQHGATLDTSYITSD